MSWKKRFEKADITLRKVELCVRKNDPIGAMQELDEYWSDVVERERNKDRRYFNS